GTPYTLPDGYGPARSPRRATGTETVVLQKGDEAATAQTDVVQPEPVPVRVKRKASRRTRIIRRAVALVVAVAMIPVVWSYFDALNAPGTDSLGVRSVEWVRDHGGNGIVNTIERWWYTNNPPPTGGRPDDVPLMETQGGTGGAAIVRVLGLAVPPPIQRLARPPARGAPPAPP